MIPRNLSGDQAGQTPWQELEFGAATISAFAELCRRSIITPLESAINPDILSNEAKAILVCGGARGVVDVRAHKDDYDSVERFLAICIETEPDSHVLFLQREDPEQTVAFLDGFAELCRNGLVVHHLGRDFSFSKSGYAVSKQLCDEGAGDEVKTLIDFATKLDH
ncbi:hypothetical protein [Mariniblastus fucicola]|uniref:Uncharacterized protein n=1 Tax=Mariniblastus fucicola TaxID=980251 RepID=A0A5B9PB64_9BACT|nr:hypothetical protein [Mariniblastus fucicola]QEG20353.1 hypothetical protein MFFC18_02000 [Mariniblastus fucicola]